LYSEINRRMIGTTNKRSNAGLKAFWKYQLNFKRLQVLLAKTYRDFGLEVFHLTQTNESEFDVYLKSSVMSISKYSAIFSSVSNDGFIFPEIIFESVPFEKLDSNPTLSIDFLFISKRDFKFLISRF
jgi:hypothetical protein